MSRILHRSLSAPGKLFLAGEYAVLWGGACRVMAVGPRTRAAVCRREDREVHLLLDAGRLSGHVTSQGVAWSTPVSPPFHFAARTLDAVLRASGQDALGFTLALSPSPLAEGGLKLGMGSSARAVVLCAEAARYVLDARFDALKLALAAHALAQGGRGSGGDVVASAVGGVLRYHRYDVTALIDAARTRRFDAALLEAPPVDLMRLPAPKVELIYAFGGQSAATTGLIAKAEAKLPESGRPDFVRRSDALGEAFEEGLCQSDRFEILREACQGLRALLGELGALESGGLERILAIAEAYGCTGKQSGAGGGDGCILFAPDPERRDALLEALRQRGFYATSVTPESGLKGESVHDPELERWLDAG